jgi:phage tail-like protein
VDVIQPAYCPLVVSAELSLLAINANPRLDFVDLILQDDLTPGVQYYFDIVRVTDLAGNEVASSHLFDSWVPTYPEDREWNLWETSIPDKNKREDYFKDLEKFVKCLDELATILITDVDKFGSIFDPTTGKPSVIKYLIGHLGNPFSFVNSLPLQQQRDLVQVLVAMYKKKGTKPGIEDMVDFFLNKTVLVVPWTAGDDVWVLNESELGFNTNLGPSRRRMLYSFSIYHLDDLSDWEKMVIDEIVAKTKPAHTHFISYVHGVP